MQIGDVARIHDVETEPRDSGHLASQQALHHLNGIGKVAAQDRRQHQGRIDGGERGRASGRRDQIPCGAFGNGLRAAIGADFGILEIGPRRFILDAVRAAGRTARGGDGGRHHDAFHAGPDGGIDRTLGAFARGNDQHVGVFRFGNTQRRRDVKNVVAAAGCFIPARIGGEIRGVEAQAILRIDRLAERCPYIRFAAEIAHGRAHGVALLQQTDHAPATDKSGAARHQHRRFVVHGYPLEYFPSPPAGEREKEYYAALNEYRTGNVLRPLTNTECERLGSPAISMWSRRLSSSEKNARISSLARCWPRHTCAP
jgi:hypothetical protein